MILALKDIIMLKLQEAVPSAMIGRGMYLHRAAQLLLELSLALQSTHIPTPGFLKDMEQLIVRLLLHARYEVVNITFNFLEALIDPGGYILSDDEDSSLPVNDNFCSHVKEWDRSHEGKLSDALRSSLAVGEILISQMIWKRGEISAECYWKTCCVLSHCPKALLRIEASAEKVLSDLLSDCWRECEGVDWTVLRCAGALVKVMQQENVCLTVHTHF
jgi:hypothetical protein